MAKKEKVEPGAKDLRSRWMRIVVPREDDIVIRRS